MEDKSSMKASINDNWYPLLSDSHSKASSYKYLSRWKSASIFAWLG